MTIGFNKIVRHRGPLQINIRSFFQIFILLSLMITVSGELTRVQAQSSDQNWQLPVNLSNSGAAAKPTLIQGSSGDMHILWEDEYARFVYRRLGDTWSESSNLDLPFYGFNYQLVASQTAGIGAFWINTGDNNLYVSTVQEDSMSRAESWTSPALIGNGVVAFAVKVDETNQVHLVYARARETVDAPAGIYYRNSAGGLANWNASQSIYQSKYYRSMISPTGPGNITISSPQIPMHVSINTTNLNGTLATYLGWENPAIKKLFFAKSVDGGVSWQEPIEVSSASQDLSLVTPMDLRTIFHDNTILQIWTVVEPGGNCGLVYRTQAAGDEKWTDPLSLESVFGSCPDQFIWAPLPSGEILFMLKKQNGVTLIAWDGNRWSLPQSEDEINQFLNPLTSDLISFEQIDIKTNGEQLLLAGKDEASSEDIWFTHKTLPDVTQWYGTSNNWTPLKVRNSDLGLIDSITTFKTQNGQLYFLISATNGTNGRSSLNVVSDVTTATVIANIEGQASQLASQVLLAQNRAIALWSGGQYGQIYSAWVDLNQPANPAGWSQPTQLQTKSLGFAPSISLASNGDLVSIFSDPYDAEKGIYQSLSTNAGESWSVPTLIPIYQNLTNCPIIDQINLTFVGSQTYQALFNCSTHTPGNNSLGLYSIESTDGGENWSSPLLVSDQPVTWNQIFSDHNNFLHRLWKVSKEKTSLFHSISSDGGKSWSSPTNFALIEEKTNATTAAIDNTGTIHLFQAISLDNGSANILYYRWQDQVWNSMPQLNLLNVEKGKISALRAGIDNAGQLQIGIVINTQKSNLDESIFLTTSYALGLTEQPETPPTVESTSIPVVDATQTNSSAIALETNTPEFDPGQINTSRASNPPIFLSIIAGILISAIFIVVSLFIIRRKNN